MKKSQIVTLVIVAAFIALLVGINSIEPDRVSARQEQEAAEAAQQIAAAEAAEDQSRNAQAAESMELAQQQAPSAEATESADPYQVEFQTTKGAFIVEIYPEWAPIGAEQFRKIIEAGIYNEARFFRVVPGFVVQWGIPGDPELARAWGQRNIQDEPVKAKNVRGTVTYAMSSAPNSRTTQVYINFGDNSQGLDSRGFAPIGKVVQGMDVVDALNAEYGQEPDQSMIETRGNAYLKEYFPNLDYIQSAKLLGEVAAPGEQDQAADDSEDAA